MFTFWRTSLVVALCCVAEAQQVRPLAVGQAHYTVKAGERIEISSWSEAAAFAHSAKSQAARASGRMIRNFAVGPNPEGDRVMLGVPLMTSPGNYTVEISLTNESGEERTAIVQVTAEPFANPAATTAAIPVVLLGGFQLGSCPIPVASSNTFGNLQTYLSGAPNNISPIYFLNTAQNVHPV